MSKDVTQPGPGYVSSVKLSNFSSCIFKICTFHFHLVSFPVVVVFGVVFFVVGYFMFCMLGKQQVRLYSHASKRFFLNPTSSHYMYVNGACVYMLCFQYRTDCLQHLSLQVREWCMCVYMLCFQVQDRLRKSPSHSQFKQEIVDSISDKQQVSRSCCSSHL